MTFDEWWATLDTREQNRRVRDDAKEAFEAGKLEAAQTILKMWTNSPTGWFPDWLGVYVEKLK